MRKTIRLLAGSLVSLIFYAVPASADQQVVANRLYDLGGRLELSVTPAAMSIFDKYTRHVGTSVGLAYYFNDYLGLEVEGGYAYIHTERKLLDTILEKGKDQIKEVEDLPLTDLKYMTWWAMGGIVLSPLYGKLSLSAEFDFNFHLYLVGGAGVADYKYSKLEWDQALTTFQKVETDWGQKPTFYFGGGLRIHFAESINLRFEIRDQFFYDEFTGQTKAITGTSLKDKNIKDFVHITMMRLSVCISFL